MFCLSPSFSLPVHLPYEKVLIENDSLKKIICAMHTKMLCVKHSIGEILYTTTDILRS